MQVIREQKTREKEAKEAELRELAMRARQERTGGPAVPLAARAADPYAVGGSQVREPDVNQTLTLPQADSSNLCSIM